MASEKKGDFGFSRFSSRMVLTVSPPGLPGEERLLGSTSSPVSDGQQGVSSEGVERKETNQPGRLVVTSEETKLRETINPTQEVSSSNHVVGVPIVKKSWVKVVQKHVFSQQKFIVSQVDGQEKVIVPKEVFVGAKPLWEDFLIGRFLNTKAPHVGKIHMIVNKI